MKHSTVRQNNTVQNKTVPNWKQLLRTIQYPNTIPRYLFVCLRLTVHMRARACMRKCVWWKNRINVWLHFKRLFSIYNFISFSNFCYTFIISLLGFTFIYSHTNRVVLQIRHYSFRTCNVDYINRYIKYYTFHSYGLDTLLGYRATS